MTYLKEKGYKARAFYLNILYLLLLVLGALATSTLNATLCQTKDGLEVTAPRYRRCYITGTQVQYDNATTKGCIAIAGSEDADGKFVPTDDIAKDQLATMDSLNGLAVSIIVFNVVVGLHSVIMHFGGRPEKFGIQYHYMFQWLISFINLGLFVGIVAVLNSEKEIQSDVNLANNLYYQDVNLFLVGVAGVVITTLDSIGSNMVVYFFCTADKGYMCWT